MKNRIPTPDTREMDAFLEASHARFLKSVAEAIGEVEAQLRKIRQLLPRTAGLTPEPPDPNRN